MKEKIEALKVWIMNNKVIAGIVAAVLLFIAYKKLAKKTYRRRRSLPRSVGIVRRRRSYRTGGTAKKAWQVKGSIAAKRHMARIRRLR